jgi:Neocarzinostatin family
VTCRSRGAPRGRGGGFILAALALLAAGCGSTAHLSAKASVPTLAVSPSTGLVGGESLHVDISGFPPRATLALFECAGTPPAGAFSCGGTQLLTLYTGHGSTASGTLVAQPAAGTAGSTTSTTPCTGQCVLVAAVEKLATELPPFSEPDATAPLSFSTTATPGLADAWLQDLSWLSPSEGWALAAQPCAAGTCARLARTTDGGEHWEPLPSVPAQVSAVDCSQVACVSDVAFASSTVGYLYGPALLMTTDGGYSWRLQPGLQVEVLAAAGGRVYRVAYEHGGCPGPCNPELQEAAIGSSAWHTVVGQLAYAGRSSGQIVGYAPSLLFALYGNLAMGYSPARVPLHRRRCLLEADARSLRGPAVDSNGTATGTAAGAHRSRRRTGGFLRRPMHHGGEQPAVPRNLHRWWDHMARGGRHRTRPGGRARCGQPHHPRRDHLRDQRRQRIVHGGGVGVNRWRSPLDRGRHRHAAGNGGGNPGVGGVRDYRGRVVDRRPPQRLDDT